MLRKIHEQIITQKRSIVRDEERRNLIRKEAAIGGQLFGPVPKGHARQFFCLDENTWVWHEEWIDMNGQRQIRTTSYAIRPSGVIKMQNGSYQAISPHEARNLRDAIRLYYVRVMRELYRQTV